MSIRWITADLGTAPAEEVIGRPDLAVVDVRNLVDKDGNDTAAVREKIDAGLAALGAGMKTVIACDYGISRSNAVAVGVLSLHHGLTFSAALRQVIDATGEREIKSGPLNAVRAAIEPARETAPDCRLHTVLVTGAGGALGPEVCARLGDTFRILAPSRSELDLEGGTTALDLFVEEQGVDGIVHLASPRVFTSNVALGKTLTMLRNVLDVCVARDVSLFYPSGWEIYSGYVGQIRANEALPAFPAGPYGETKHLAELMIGHWRRTTDLRCCLLRSGPVYGPGLPKPKFIGNFIGKARRGDPIFTHLYRNGEPALDLLHVSDFADAVASAVKASHWRDLNIGTGVLSSTRHVAETIRDLLASSSVIDQTAVDSYCASIAMDCTRATALLGWSAKTRLRDGLSQIVLSHREGS